MKVEMICHCGEIYHAKSADLVRGWGFSCDKGCAAKRRMHGYPKAKPVGGGKIKQTKKTPSTNRPNDHRTYGDGGDGRDSDMGDTYEWDDFK